MNQSRDDPAPPTSRPDADITHVVDLPSNATDRAAVLTQAALAASRAASEAAAVHKQEAELRAGGGDSPPVDKAVTDPSPSRPVIVLALIAAVAVCVIGAALLDWVMDPHAFLECSLAPAPTGGSGAVIPSVDARCTPLAVNAPESWTTSFHRYATQPESAVHRLLASLRVVLVIAFSICALELALMALRKVGIPALTLKQARQRFNETRERVKEDRKENVSNTSVFGDIVKQLIIQPQFMLTVILGATATAGVVAHEVPPIDDSAVRQLALSVGELKGNTARLEQNTTVLRSTLIRMDAATRIPTPAEPPTPALNARIDALLEYIRSHPAASDLAKLQPLLVSMKESIARLEREWLANGGTRRGKGASNGVLKPEERPANSADIESLRTELLVLKASLGDVSKVVNGTSSSIDSVRAVVGESSDNERETIASELHRLRRHELVLDHRLYRTIAREELLEILDDKHSKP